ncbi:MFS transporter small subunit [Microbacterium phosphatis]
MSEQKATGSGSQTVRLVVSWLIVGVPLVYGLVMTITSVTPLFTG